jgi:hypothetical protein
VTARRWSPGDAIVMRHYRDAYRWAAPMRVVEDRGDFVVLYLQPGSAIVRMGDADGRSTREFASATHLVESTWGLNHALHLIREGDRHATMLLWDQHTWEFRCWYLNYQDPLRRFALGFETMDLTLDTLISPDRANWRWKDEVEFEDGIRFGWYTREQLADLKAYGERVVADALAGAPPFDAGWEHWRPDPAWAPLTLPEGWDAGVG